MGLWAFYYGKMFPENNSFVSAISTIQSLLPSEISGPLWEVQDNTLLLWVVVFPHAQVLKTGRM